MTLLSGKAEYVDITVTTEATVPSLVSNVRITSVKSSELSISWDAPMIEVNGDIGDLVERYEGRKVIPNIAVTRCASGSIPDRAHDRTSGDGSGINNRLDI